MAASIDSTLSTSGEKESAENYPKEIAASLKAFQSSLEDVDEVLAPLMNASMPEIHNQLTPLDRAKLDLVSAYAINSLFWVYLGTQGINPREHAIRHELGRIQKYMKRAQEISDKPKAPRVDKDAAKRFIKHSIPNQPGDKATRKRKADEQGQGSAKR
ncbi:nuclear nucleic acid-binding protein C1D-like [Amphiura filiformis]|uniref:nuclear nucleic acid-binding protein C1D-like n=1 Tax=Amphiura filiformis TaxID=82378 RepID=UPI003B214670